MTIGLILICSIRLSDNWISAMRWEVQLAGFENYGEID